jgi:cell division protein FtsW (lipid II flippase)
LNRKGQRRTGLSAINQYHLGNRKQLHFLQILVCGLAYAICEGVQNAQQFNLGLDWVIIINKLAPSEFIKPCLYLTNAKGLFK